MFPCFWTCLPLFASLCILGNVCRNLIGGICLQKDPSYLETQLQVCFGRHCGLQYTRTVSDFLAFGSRPFCSRLVLSRNPRERRGRWHWWLFRRSGSTSVFRLSALRRRWTWTQFPSPCIWSQSQNLFQTPSYITSFLFS